MAVRDHVPLGGIALVLIMGALPRTPVAHHRFDWLSALLSAVTDHRYRQSSSALYFCRAGAAAATVAGALFVWRQLLLPYPMLAVELFARPVFALSVATSVCSFTAQNLAFVSLPFFFEEVLGRSAVETGLLMTPWPLAVGFVAPIAGWLADKRYPVGILGGMGLATMSVGLVLLSFRPGHAAIPEMAWWMAICGVGFGFFQSPNNRTILASAPPDRAGSARGILAAARLVGQTFGAALVGLIFALTSVSPRGISHGATLACSSPPALPAPARSRAACDCSGSFEPSCRKRVDLAPFGGIGRYRSRELALD